MTNRLSDLSLHWHIPLGSSVTYASWWRQSLTRRSCLGPFNTDKMVLYAVLCWPIYQIPFLSRSPLQSERYDWTHIANVALKAKVSSILAHTMMSRSRTKSRNWILCLCHCDEFSTSAEHLAMMHDNRHVVLPEIDMYKAVLFYPYSGTHKKMACVVLATMSFL